MEFVFVSVSAAFIKNPILSMLFGVAAGAGIAHLQRKQVAAGEVVPNWARVVLPALAFIAVAGVFYGVAWAILHQFARPNFI